MIFASLFCGCQKNFEKEPSQEEFEFLAAVPDSYSASLYDALRNAKIPNYYHGSLAMGFFVHKSKLSYAKGILEKESLRHHYKPIFDKK